MNLRAIITVNVLVAIVIALTALADGVLAVGLATICVFATISLLKRLNKDDKAEQTFLVAVFLLGLAPRALLAMLIAVYHLEYMFGPDAFLYDIEGKLFFQKFWNAPEFSFFSPNHSSMNILVGTTYILVGGQNVLAAQLISALFGAATAPIVYLCAQLVFKNSRVARYSALFIALFPAMIVWSSQLLKDGFIVFFIALAMLLILRLQRSFNYLELGLLLFSLFFVYTLRFYVLPLLAVSAVGSFLLGAQMSLPKFLGRCAALVVIGVGLASLGLLNKSIDQIERFTDLREIQNSRQWAASKEAADSGFAAETDVSTTSGALTALPLGMAHLLAAPFPWQMQKTTQLALLPEMIIWWASLPLMFFGLWYIMKNRLRESISILLFVVMLSISYSLYQGNLGTLYRQRTQVQVFMLIFTGVGLALYLEQREAAEFIRLQRARAGRRPMSV